MEKFTKEEKGEGGGKDEKLFLMFLFKIKIGVWFFLSFKQHLCLIKIVEKKDLTFFQKKIFIKQV